MAPQPTAPGLQPPPDVPSDPGLSDTMTNYLRTFALWCRNMFNDKLAAHAALPGVMLQAYDTAAQNPPVYIARVTSAGVLTLTPMALGTGALGTPISLASKRGVTDGSSAAAGEIGEYLTATSGSVALATTVWTNIISLPVPPGDWDLWGSIALTAPGGANNFQGGIATVSGGAAQEIVLSGPTATAFYGAIPARRVSVTVTTTYYITSLVVFSSGTASAVGGLRARRAR